MSEIKFIEIADWVGRASADPVLHFERQASEIILNAIGMLEDFKDKIFLKGGVLMGVVYDSPRHTSDLDFTITLPPEKDIGFRLSTDLDQALIRSAIGLGYPDIVCRTQRVAAKPKKDSLEKGSFPALSMTIAYAMRGSAEERHLNRRRSTRIVELDLSFNEPIGSYQIVKLGQHGSRIHAYSLCDLIAEKLRALLQQTRRNRGRRQDIYDISLLLRRFQFDEAELRFLHKTFQEKCRARQIEPDVNSLSDPDVIRRAEAEWGSLALELGSLPPFFDCFEAVEKFYRSFPWGISEPS